MSEEADYQRAVLAVLALPPVRQQALYTHLGALLKDAGDGLARDPDLDRRMEALDVMRRAAAAIGLSETANLTVKQFDAAPVAVRGAWRSGQIVKLFGKWKFAVREMRGERGRMDGGQRERLRSMNIKGVAHEDAIVSLQTWLATRPSKTTERLYGQWVRTENARSDETRLIHWPPNRIRQELGIAFPEAVKVAKGEIDIGNAKKVSPRRASWWSDESYDVIALAEVREMLDLSNSMAQIATHRVGFPVPVLMVDDRRFWVRSDVATYAAGGEVMVREVDELRYLYVAAPEVATQLGIAIKSIDGVTRLPKPVGYLGGVRFWRRAEIDALIELRRTNPGRSKSEGVRRTR